jgi:hypothetical protein
VPSFNGPPAAATEQCRDARADRRLAAHDLLQPEGTPPGVRMKEWNERTKDLYGYSYGHVSNYVRDAKVARERLTYLPVDWRSALLALSKEA